MKVPLLFVATTPFAVNAFLKSHLLALARTYEVTLCVDTKAYPLAGEIERLVHVMHIDIPRKISLLQDLRALAQILRCLHALRPAVIHSITPKAGLLAMVAGWLMRVPIRFHIFTGQVWATKTGGARHLLRWADRLISACATRVFADSASQVRLLVRERIVRADHISVIGAGSVCGVDLSRFHPSTSFRLDVRTSLGTPENALVYLFVGRVVRDKGVFDLIDAFTRLGSDPDSMELWMVGPDEDGLADQLMAMGSRSMQRIRWLGPSTTPERFMAAADILVLPSYREGFGSVVIEAAACGIPAISYRIDGIVDAVSHKETGLLVALGDVEAFSAAMHHLAANEKERNALGLSARLRVVSKFSSEDLTREWLTLYEKVLSSARKA